MNGKVFFDTNVILYSYSETTERKNEIAQLDILNSADHLVGSTKRMFCLIFRRLAAQAKNRKYFNHY